MILTDLSLPSLGEAMEANLQRGWLRLGRALNATIYDQPDLLWFHSGLPFHLANGVIQSRFSDDLTDAALKQSLKQLAAQHVSMAWLIGPSTRPANLGERLEKHGWFHDQEAPGMAIDLRTLDESLSPPSRLSVERVSDGTTLQKWLRVMCQGSEMPASVLDPLFEVARNYRFEEEAEVICYLGRLDGRPAATSMLYLDAGVAGIYNVATLPEDRGQGLGTALTLASLLDARVRGYRIGVLQSSLMGLNIYRRLGFREYCTFHGYFWQGE